MVADYESGVSHSTNFLLLNTWVVYHFHTIKVYLFTYSSDLYTWGSNSRPQDQESHTPPAEWARRLSHFDIKLSSDNILLAKIFAMIIY